MPSRVQKTKTKKTGSGRGEKRHRVRWHEESTQKKGSTSQTVRVKVGAGKAHAALNKLVCLRRGKDQGEEKNCTRKDTQKHGATSLSWGGNLEKRTRKFGQRRESGSNLSRILMIRKKGKEI